MSKGEAKDIGKARGYILANTMKLGAVYLDQGYDVTSKFIADTLFGKIDTIIEKAMEEILRVWFRKKLKSI